MRAEGHVDPTSQVVQHRQQLRLEAHLIPATLVQRMTFELVPGQTIEPEPLITLRPKGGVRVVRRRYMIRR